MSKKNRRPQPRTRIIEQERPQVQRRTPNIRPGATNFKPLSDSVIQMMYQNMGPQANVDAMYSPGAPLRPVPGLVPVPGIRGWDYPVGVNIGRLPRSTEVYNFADLRALSSSYYGIQMCQQVWFDYISQLELDIQPRKDLIGEDGDISMYADAIQEYKDFFEYPDKDHDLHSWMQMAVKDQLEIDAVAIYPRKDRAGRLYSLDLIDASMLTPLVDDRGRKPLPPFPAFTQFVHGVPAALLTSDELIYVKETEQTHSLYGFPRTQRIILNVNIALRKQTKDLAHFTDGTLPPGFVQPSMDVQWSQEEIEAWEMQLNNLMAGNDELRARLKVLPRGFEYKAVMDPDIHLDLDQFLLNITAACHGLTMAELAFVADVNRSTGDSQENVVYRRAMGPLMKRYARLFTMILHKYFNEKRFIVSFKGYEETEDLQANATAYTMLTNAGILGLSDAAKLMKLPEDPDAPHIGRVYMSKDGPIFLDDMASDEMRNAQMKAKLAGFDMAANPPEQAPDDNTQQENSKDDSEEEEKKSPALARLTAQVEEILERLSRSENQRPEVLQKHTGIMVAFLLDPDIAELLALPGGESVDNIHITLCHLGDTSTFTGNIENLKLVLANFAYSAVPLEGNVSGIGRFNPNEDGITPVYASVNVHGLHHFHGRLVHALELVGYTVSHVHAYTPHITLAYIPEDDPIPVSSVPELPLELDTIWLCVGDERFAFPFGEMPLLEDGEDDPTERMITALLLEDEDEPLTSLERDWSSFDSSREHKGRKHAMNKEAQAKVAAEVEEQMEKIHEEQKDGKEEKEDQHQAKQSSQLTHAKAAAHAKVAAHHAKARQAVTHATHKAARASTHAQKVQAAAARQEARATAKAAKALASLTKSIGAKASVYEALANRKLSKTWTAQDAANAKAIAGDLTKLVGMVGSHEGDAASVIADMQNAIQELLFHSPKTMSAARITALKKIEDLVKSQISRAQSLDWFDAFDDDGAYDNAEEDTKQTEETQRAQSVIPSPAQLQPVTDDYRRWRGRALEDVKAGRSQRGFSSTLIPEHVHTWISRELALCNTSDDVRSVFSRARDMTHEPLITSKEELARGVHAVFSRVTERGRNEIALMESE